jgi:hypothetical protein
MRSCPQAKFRTRVHSPISDAQHFENDFNFENTLITTKAGPSCVPLRLKLTDWESVFRSAKDEFCRPRSVRPLLERRTKSHSGRRADCGSLACRFAAQFLGLGAAADNASLPRQASRGFSSPRHHANCTFPIVISALSNPSTLTRT